MIKFEKIEDKELVLVEGQGSCSVKGKPSVYTNDFYPFSIL